MRPGADPLCELELDGWAAILRVCFNLLEDREQVIIESDALVIIKMLSKGEQSCGSLSGEVCLAARW
ncbi:hypothetical protein ACFX19_047816 [Malus domestica]